MAHGWNISSEDSCWRSTGWSGHWGQAGGMAAPSFPSSSPGRSPWAFSEDVNLLLIAHGSPSLIRSFRWFQEVLRLSSEQRFLVSCPPTTYIRISGGAWHSSRSLGPRIQTWEWTWGSTYKLLRWFVRSEDWEPQSENDPSLLFFYCFIMNSGDIFTRHLRENTNGV